MDTNNLNAFLLVAEHGSFSMAAEKLHLTQPAVSKRIALLEEQLDTVLFDRIARNVTLTEAGTALLPHARSVQREIAAAQQSVRDLAGRVAGKLRLATSHHIGLHRLPPVLSYFTRTFPDVQLDIEFTDSEHAHDLITRGDIELAIVTLSPEPRDSVISIAVWPDPLDFMVAPEHPLCDQPGITLQQMSQHPAILPGLNTYTGQIVKRLFDTHQLTLQLTMATNYLETVRMMASVGLGWTVLPRTMADDTLVRLEVEQSLVERTLGVIYHPGRSLSRAAQSFIETVETS